MANLMFNLTLPKKSNGGGSLSRATSRGEAMAPVSVSDSASSMSSAATRARRGCAARPA